MKKMILFIACSVSVCTSIFAQSYEALVHQVIALENQGKFKEAIPLIIKAKKEAPRVGVDSLIILGFLGNAYESTGNYVMAESIYSQILRSKRNRREYDQSYEQELENIAGLCRNMGNYEQAETYLEELVAMQNTADPQFYPDNSGHIKLVDDDNADFDKQLSLLKQGKIVLHTSANRNGHINVDDPWQEVDELIDTYIQLAENKKAEHLLKNVIAIERATNPLHLPNMDRDRFNYVSNLILLDGLYKKTNKTAEAKKLLDTIFTSFNKLDFDNYYQDRTDLFLSLGGICAQLTDFNNAEKLYKKELAAVEKRYGKGLSYYSITTTLANLYEVEKRYADSEALLKEALAFKTSDQQFHLNILIQLTDLYLLTDRFHLAEQYCLTANKPFLNNIQQNLSLLSEAEKIKWLDSQTSLFNISASLLLNDQHPIKEFLGQTCNQQLQLKGFVLSDEEKVFQLIRKSSNSHVQQLLDKWESDRTAYAWLSNLPSSNNNRQKTDSLQQIINDEEKQINRQSTAFLQNRQNKQIGYADIQHHLQNDEASIEFVRFNYRHKKQTDSISYAAFVILPNDSVPHFLPLFEEKQLSRLLGTKSASSPFSLYGSGTKRQARSDSLYNLIWKPIQPLITGIKHLAISPVGLLNRIAFSALSSKNNIYLADGYDIRQYSSTREIAEPPSPVYGKRNKNNAVLYGGIFYDGANKPSSANLLTAQSTTPPYSVKRNFDGIKWEPLPGTLMEVDSIKKIFTDNHLTATVISGSAATEESLKQYSGHSPWILHLATHGFALPFQANKSDFFSNKQSQLTFDENPLFRSGLIMAGANRVWCGGTPISGTDDGILTAYEISNLDLSNTNLVILSACETALGDIKGDEGVFGLQRAFKFAGVKDMLLSLWSVPDVATSQLMEQFYINKLKGLPNYEALNLAQASMRKKYPPAYWAGFVLIE